MILHHPAADLDCPDCHGRGLVIRRKGPVLAADPCHCLAPVCPACDDSRLVSMAGGFVPCDCARVARRGRWFDAARLPGRYAHATLAGAEGLHAELLRAWVDGWRPVEEGGDGRGILLHGNVGTGKTHLVVGAARALVLHHGAQVRFVEFTHLVSDLKASFDRGEGATGLLEPLARVDILVIDELGKGRLTEFEDTLVDELISRRYNAGLPLLATTNYAPGRATGRRTANNADPSTLPSLADRLGERVYSRLREMCDFHPIAGPDLREPRGRPVRARG